MKARVVVLLVSMLAMVSLWLAAAPVAVRIFGQGAVSASSLVTERDGVQPMAVDLAPVLDFAPFGQAEALQSVALPEGESAGLVLLGLTMAIPQDRSRAIIAGGAVPVANYGMGDVISPGVTVAGVFADHVVINLAGQEQALFFAQDDAGLAGTITAAGPQAPADAAAAADDTAGDEAALGRYRAEAQQDPAGLLQRLGLQPGANGYLVTASAAEIVLSAGLQPGDLVGSVNGTPLGNPSQDAALFDKVAALGLASVSVLRGDKTLLMTFPLP